MIPITLAIELKNAGLIWQTANLDFFAIPDRDLDNNVFVLADIMAYTELLQGWPVVAFHGAAEWALDYIFTSEVVWMPREEQLQAAIIKQLAAIDPNAELTMLFRAGQYTCNVSSEHLSLQFERTSAAEAYGLVLLHILRSQNQ